MTTSDVIQLLAVLAAVAASLIALYISARDRRTQIDLARKEREQARLSIELEYAIRLSTNRNMGGSADPAESKRLGAEAMALALVVGQRWVPQQYHFLTEGKSIDELRDTFDNPESPEWVKWRNEAAAGVLSIVEALHSGSPGPATQRPMDDGKPTG